MLLPIAFFVTVDRRAFAPHAEWIREALHEAKITLDAACIWMGDGDKPYDASLFKRQLAGEGHVSYTRLSKLPLKFWKEFAAILLVQVGIPSRYSRAARLDRIARRGRKHMAKMGVASINTDDKAKTA